MPGVFDTSLGVLLIGIFFNTFLYGLVTFQYAAYHNTKFYDPRWIRSLVLILFCLDTFQSTSLIYLAWAKAAAKNYANSVPLWPYPLTVVTTSVTAFLVQIFLAYRIYRLKTRKLLCGAIFLLSLSSLVVGIVCGVAVWHVQSKPQIAHVGPLVAAWLSLEVGVDILITVILCYVLAQSRTGFHRSDTIINRLIRATIQTGLLSGIFAGLTLVFFVRFPGSNYYGMLGIPIGRIYTTTLMDTLLVRHNLRAIVTNQSEFKDQTNGIWVFEDIRFSRAHSGDTSIQLHIRKEVYVDVGTKVTSVEIPGKSPRSI